MASVIVASLFAIAIAMLLVRLGWSGRRGAAAAGWTLNAAALILLATRAGAWGLAIGMLAAIATAAAILLHAGWTEPARHRRPPRQAPAIALPRRPADAARRLLVFVFVVPVAFVAAQWLAFGAQALVRHGGAGAADANVTMLFLQPLLWSGVMTWQMTRRGPAQMIAAPALTAAAGTLLWALA